MGSTLARLPRGPRSPEEVATPGVTTIEALAELLGIDSAATSKVTTAGKLVLGLVRGDDRLSEPKMVGVLESDYRPATDEEIRATFGAGGGSLGPVGVDVEIIADEALREVTSLPEPTVTGGTPGRRGRARLHTAVRRHSRGTRGRSLSGVRWNTPLPDGDRGRPHLQVRVSLLEPLGATFLDEDGTEKPLVGGSYGVGPARVMAAAVEQSHDENGIVWPAAIAPYDVHVLSLDGGAIEVVARARKCRDAGRRRLRRSARRP